MEETQQMHSDATQPAILEWLRGHLIVINPTAIEEMRQSLKKVADSEKMHRAMHGNRFEWEVRREEDFQRRFLPEELEMLCVVHPLTEAEANQKRELIVQHRSEFPSKLRSAIDQASNDSQDDDAWDFLARVYEAAKVFFLGTHPDMIPNDETRLDLSAEWLGLDSTVDTKDQAETAIRFFPMLLTEHLQLSYAILNPIQLLLSREKAVSFVPLFAKLLVEAGKFLERESVVRLNLRNIYELLLTNCFPQLLVRGEISKSFDQESLLALTQLREMGFVEDGEVGLLIMSLLAHSMESQREMEFVETRLRLLIGWNPSVLRNGANNNRPLLHTIYSESTRTDRNASLFLRMFQVVADLGMTHYPKELGFIFHKWGGTFPLHRFALTHGSERISEIVNEKLLCTIGSNVKTLSSLVTAVATNDKIHLSGLYSLLSLNPIVCKPPNDGNC